MNSDDARIPRRANDDSDRETADRQPDITRADDLMFCGKHGITYLQSRGCPRCAQESQSRG